MENLKILIIEDDPTTCNLLKTTLELEGYQASFVHSVENDDVAALLNDQQPDLLFLDFHLGNVNALKYMTAIRNDSHWQNLPVLMTSAIDLTQECLEAGANGCIVKPFNWDEIAARVSQIRNQIFNGKEA